MTSDVTVVNQGNAMTERNLQSPVWHEGMTLDPHHFQQWDRHQRYELAMRVRALQPLGWGFLALDIDREALANGQFSLRAVLPGSL